MEWDGVECDVMMGGCEVGRTMGRRGINGKGKGREVRGREGNEGR